MTAPLTTNHGEPVTYARHGKPAAGERDFRNVLGVSLNSATRLASLLALVALSVASPLSAQSATGQQPVVQPAPSVGAAPAGTNTATPATTATAPLVIDLPKFEMAPLVPIKNGRQPAVPVRPSPRLGNASNVPPQPRAPRPGNGADLAPQGAAARQPMNRVVVDSAEEVPPKAQSAMPAAIAADDAIMRMMPQMDVKLGGDGENGGLRLNGTVGIVIMMGLLTLLPTLLLMMTGFTRILIVLQFLKQAMGTQSAPPGQLLAAMALLLTGFVMGPTLSEMNRTAITPWLDGKMTQVEMMKEGVKPMREFMLKQTRESDIKTFVELSRMPRPATVDDVPLHVLMSAFVASELRTAFQIGFAIYLPFIIIDAVVASVLMSMGMFMLPPAMISLPFKLLLFVLVDGWSLTITSLVQSFK
ncbi:flagellar type III secretion system pore protein FliP [Gemmatimonas sp.]